MKLSSFLSFYIQFISVVFLDPSSNKFSINWIDVGKKDSFFIAFLKVEHY